MNNTVNLEPTQSDNSYIYDFQAQAEALCVKQEKKRRLSEKASYIALAIALCVLVGEIAFFWMDGAFGRAASNIEHKAAIAEAEQYFAEHKGEPSGYAIGQEKGWEFSYGLAIAKQEETAEDSALVPYANSQLALVPDYIKEHFIASGWKFEITAKDLTQQYLAQDVEDQVYTVGDNEVVMGLTSPTDSTIYISDTAYAVQQSAVHEMGHYVDRALGHISLSDEFAEAMGKDEAIYRFYFPYSHLDEEQEFFAEAFQAYWKHPSEMESLCPELYSFFNSRF